MGVQHAQERASLKDVSIFDLIIVLQRWGRLAIGPVMGFYQSESDAASKFVKPRSKRTGRLIPPLGGVDPGLTTSKGR
jgi:hypothetical protein